MADELRRSVRATKGQHTNKDDVEEEPTPVKKKGGKKGKKAAAQEQEPEEIIRCVCGVVEPVDNDTDAWIACDNCDAWQHNVCVGVSTFGEDIPKKYFCEQCRPQDHKALLDGIKRGEKLWEERRRKYDLEQENLEQEADEPKKKGKKKGKRASDPKAELAGTNGKAKSSTPLPAEKKDKKVASAKRNRDDSHENVGKEPKQRKVTAHATPRQDSPQIAPNIVDLETSRQNPAKLIAKALVHAIPIAIKAGIYALNKNDTVEAKADRLAGQIEAAVNGTSPDKQEYLKQCRALFSNLKTNQELCNGLLTRSLTPAALAVMSIDDMASKELKKETAEMKARADKQSIMVTDDGPRMRRTHKGDELIEGDSFASPSDNIPSMSAGRRRSMLDPNADMATRSRENSPGEEVELPADINSYRSRDDIRGNTIPKQPLSVATKPSQVRKQSSASNFDLNKVLSSVQSPTSPVGFNRRASSNNAPPANGPGVDPDIDRLLQDDDTPPYSPAEYDSDPEIIWRGTINMSPVAEFSAVAKHVAGVDINKNKIMPWSELLTKDLKIAGRIQSERANEYLCSLRYSPQTDLTVIKVTPTPNSQQGFTDLYDYFQTKDRYGVLQNRSAGNIRDTYLVPIPPNPLPIPDFLTNLEGHKISMEDRSEPGLLIALVIRHELPQSIHTPSNVDVTDSPSLPSHQRVMSQSNPNGPQMSPLGSLQGGPFSAPPPQYQQSPHPVNSSLTEQQIKQRDCEGNATRILGEHARAPTIAFLMPQAWQMRDVEWEVIREVLANDEKARTDLGWLNALLEKRFATLNPAT